MTELIWGLSRINLWIDGAVALGEEGFEAYPMSNNYYLLSNFSIR